MNKKELQQLHKKSDADITKELHQHRLKLWELKRDLIAGKVKNVREIKKIKKTVAQLLTQLTWRKKSEVSKEL